MKYLKKFSMETGLEALAKMDYPGRVIIVGTTKDNIPFVSYAITGRGQSSQARRMVEDKKIKGCIQVVPTDEKLIKQGDPNLLIYPAISTLGISIVVSNGKQTEGFMNALDRTLTPVERLHKNLQHWEYEPDPPNFTPRITGLVTCIGLAGLSILKRAENRSTIRHYFGFELIPGKGKFISTYTGENKDPLPSFQGEPIELVLDYTFPQNITDAVYNALAPKKEGQKDFRVSVATLSFSKLDVIEFTSSIKNRHGE